MKNWFRILILFILIGLVSLSLILFTTKIRRNSKQDSMDYSASIRTEKKRFTATEGDTLTIRFRLKNKGQKTWSSQGQNPYLFSYHLLDSDGTIIQYDNRRFSFSEKVFPQQTVELLVRVKSPLYKGLYTLEFDLLREGLSWFSDYGSSPLPVTLTVKKRTWPEEGMRWTLDYGKFNTFFSSEEKLNVLYKLIRLTLDKNEVIFEGKTGSVFGFSPGTDYSQIWLRDANTIIPASQLFYGKNHLTSWLEEHLAFQQENGSLEDWIDPQGASGKNTTETDQEASAVQSAYQIYRLVGPGWLQKKLEGEEVIRRLDRALVFVLQNRFDRHHGLIIGAHTADWGDMDIVDSDEKAVDIDERTHWTADIYDQSMFYAAARQLAEMLGETGQKNRALFWEKQADCIKKNTNLRLWQENRGFYKVHLHLDELRHDFDEEDIFAMGGNVLAIISGVAEAAQAARIIEQALDRQESYQVSTVSGVLLPPYPQNFFKHPQLDSPFEYQNGAQWDWFGGRLITAMFHNGFSKQAKEKLHQIISKNMTNRGFFEWDDRQGTGRGSDFFCGSAGSLSQAVFEGYLGINMTRDGLRLEPRLIKDNCRVHVYIPASDSFVAYEYRYSSEKDRVTLAFNSNIKNKGQIRILSPWDQPASLTVRLDSQSIPYALSRINHDTYIVIVTDFNSHRLEVQKRDQDHFRPKE